MATDTELELNKQQMALFQKYDFFLMAAAAASIALTLQRTAGTPLSWSMFPLGIALFLWALSFYFGCRRQGFLGLALYQNLAMLQVGRGADPKTPQNPAERAYVCELLRSFSKENSDKAACRAKWQFRTLILGGVSFVVWHVLDMPMKTPGLFGNP